MYEGGPEGGLRFWVKDQIRLRGLRPPLGDEPKAKSPVSSRMQPIWVQDGSGGFQTWEETQISATYLQDIQHSQGS